MAELERKREKIVGKVVTIYKRHFPHCLSSDVPMNFGHEVADQILHIKLGTRTLQEWIELHEKGKLLVKAENQDLPLAGPFSLKEADNVRKARQDMLTPDSEGRVWVKVLPSQE
jgi:hypothetical protein